MRSKKYISIFLMALMQSDSCSEGSSLYQPKSYPNIMSVEGKTLYPGDSFTHSYQESFYGNDSVPVTGTMMMMEIPVLDARYFTIEQLSVASSSNGSGNHHLNYTITIKCTVKNLTATASITIPQFLFWGSEQPTPIAVGATSSILKQTLSVSLTVAPLSSGVTISEKPLRGFGGYVYSLADLKGKTLYPGDVIKIDNLITSQFSSDNTLGLYEYMFTPYRDFMDFYQDPTSQLVQDQGSNKSEANFYFVIKDTVKKPCTFDIMRWECSVGALKGANTYGYAKLTSLAEVSILPGPDFLKLIRNNPDLGRALRWYLSDKQGCKANAQDVSKRTPLMWSIFYDQEDVVKYFLSDPVVSLVGQDKDKRTALMYAAQRNNQEIARLLLAKDSAYQALPLQDKDGMTMLHYAAWNNNYSMVQNILTTKSIKSFINSVTSAGVTSLMYASAQANKKLVQLLLDNKADYTLVDKNGFNCLSYACMSLNIDFVNYLYGYISSQNKAAAQAMIQAVAKDQTNLIYNTILMGKTDADFYTIVEFLIGQGVPLESKYDGTKNSALQPYLQAPADQRGVYGSILALVCSNGTQAAKTIQLLLQQGARVTPEVLTVAQRNGVGDLINTYGNAAGALLYQALYNGDTATALRVAKQFDSSMAFSKAMANYTNSGWSVLFLLAAQAQGDKMAAYNAVATELVQRGANINIVGPDEQGNPVTPLVWSVNNGNTQLQNLLQTSGSKFSQTVASTITIDTAVASSTSSITKKPQVQPSGLVSGNSTQMSTAAVSESVEAYDSVEYLLG